VDPVTMGAVLVAAVSGAGGALGAQAWQGVCALVRRPFRRGRTGAAELKALRQAPRDQQRAVELARVLIARADRDPGFGDALAAWWQQAGSLGGQATNTITGGTFQGPVLQGRDFTGLSFGAGPTMDADE
jgi:hypothetical protein